MSIYNLSKCHRQLSSSLPRHLAQPDSAKAQPRGHYVRIGRPVGRNRSLAGRDGYSSHGEHGSEGEGAGAIRLG